MPNYCDFEMKINGKKENREKLISYLKSDYYYERIDNENYKLKKCDADKHFFRIFQLDKLCEEDGLDCEYSIVDGACAWSVVSCMFNEEADSYYGDWANNNFYNCKDFKGTHMEAATKDLDLEVEIFSKEPGLEFMEHYLVDRGKVLLSDCVYYSELYDDEGEPILDEYGNQMTEGGIEWEYTI